MTPIRGLAVVAFMLMASPPAVAQQSPQSQAEWQRMSALGIQHRTAWDLYQAMTQAAGGGRQSPPFNQLPDWSGLWTAGGGGSLFGAALGRQAEADAGRRRRTTRSARISRPRASRTTRTSANADPRISALARHSVPPRIHRPARADVAVVGNREQRSPHLHRRPRSSVAGRCVPALLRRFHRILGRPEAGDPHQSAHGPLHGAGPAESERADGDLEVWEKIDSRTIKANVWIYDPTIYVEPWYLQRRYRAGVNPDKPFG